MPVSASTVFPAVIALVAVLALVLLAGRAARLTGLARNTGERRLVLRDTLTLDRARRLHLVRCDGRELLLLTGGGQDQVVGWLTPPGAEVA